MSEEIIKYSIFNEPIKTVKCIKCGEVYKGDNETRVYEMDKRFNGLCNKCYLKKLNSHLTEDDIINFANWSMNQTDIDTIFWRKHPDIDVENWNKKIVPKISELIQKEQEEKEEQYHKQKLEEAIKLIYSDCTKVDSKTPSISVTLFEKTVAKLLEKIDNLEEQIQQKRLYD